jgi:Holliday junction resolvase RusA-like endonuclease
MTRKGHVYTPDTAEAWKQNIVMGCRALHCNLKLKGALRIDRAFVLPRPKYLNTDKHPAGLIWHDVKPDIDNLDKALLDALKRADVLSDDCVVADGRASKYYAKREGKTGCWLRISRPDEAEDLRA